MHKFLYVCNVFKTHSISRIKIWIDFWAGSGGKCNHLGPLLRRWSLWRDGYKMTSRGTTIFVHYVLMSIAKTPIRLTPISDNDSTLEKSSGVHNYDSLLPRNMSVDRNTPKYGSFYHSLIQGTNETFWFVLLSLFWDMFFISKRSFLCDHEPVVLQYSLIEMTNDPSESACKILLINFWPKI